MKYIKMSVSDLKEKGLICREDDPLGAVLAAIDQPNGSRLVFDNQENFLGILSVYHTLFRKQSDPLTKVRHLAITPFHITPETSIGQIAKYMAGERIDIVPVFEDDQLSGIITTASMADEIKQNGALLDQISLDPTTVEVCQIGQTVREVYPLLRKKGVEQVVVTDQFGKLQGVISRVDLKHAFIHPTEKQRFGKDAHRPTDWAFDEEKIKRLDDPIRNYFNPEISVVSEDEAEKAIIRSLLNKPEIPLVIRGSLGLPAKLITFRDLLHALGSLENTHNSVNIIIKNPGNNVSPAEYDRAIRYINSFAEKMSRRNSLEKIEINSEEAKYPSQKTAIFDITVIVVPYGKGQYIAQAKAKNFFQGLNSAVKQIEKQFQRDHVVKSNHKRKSLAENTFESGTVL